MRIHLGQKARALLCVITVASVPLLVSCNPRPLAPSVSEVVVQPDEQTVQVTWQHTGQTLQSYEIWWRSSGTSDWQWVSTAAGGEDRSWVPVVAGQTTYVERLKMPASVANTKIDVAVAAIAGTCPPDTNCSDREKAKVTDVQMDAPPPVLPAQCASTQETFCTVFPDAFVKGAHWPVGEQGQAVTLNGANIKHAPYLNGAAWTTSSVVNEVNNGFGSPGAPDWNAIRLNMDWPTYQIEQGSTVTVDETALQQLDAVIDAAAAQGYYVILVPAHTRQPRSLCGLSPRMADATHDIPKWMWDRVAPGLTPDCSGWSSAHQDKEDEVFARPEFRTYVRTLADRYADFSTPTKATRSRTVVAFDLINEPRGSGGLQTRQANMIDNYRTIIEDVRDNSAATDKIMMAEPVHGDTSLAQNSADLASLAASSSNIVWSFHDYFGGGTGGASVPTDATWGYGRDVWGFATGYERTDGLARPYQNSNDLAQHRTYVEEVVGWSTAHQLPVFIGEYGVFNPCKGNVASEALAYATETRDLYDSIPASPGSSTTVSLSRTWWTNGSGGAMDLLRKDPTGPAGCGPSVGSYFAHAAGTG